MNGAGWRNWLASGDTALPRMTRRALRSVKRSVARLRSGSITAEMDRIVAEAVSRERGSGLSIGYRELTQRRRATAQQIKTAQQAKTAQQIETAQQTMAAQQTMVDPLPPDISGGRT